MALTVQAVRDRIAGAAGASSLRLLDRALASRSDALWNLQALAPEEILDAEELATLTRLEAEPPTAKDGVHPHTVIILKATRICNLRCTYCYSWREGPGQTMTFEVLVRLFRDLCRSKRLNSVDVVWHGGEVTLLPMAYVRKAVWLQQHFAAPGVTFANCIQTNATRLTPEWVTFFRDHEFSVGVSIDGPPEVHDSRRLTKSGKPTWHDVKAGMDLLKESGIPYGALAVVDKCVLELGADAYLAYLHKLGIKGLAFLNAIPSNSELYPTKDHYAPWAQYTEFLRQAFDVWWSRFRDDIEIRELRALVDAVGGKGTALCVFRDNCMGQYLTVEPNGDVGACEKYVGDQTFVYGSLVESPLGRMLCESGPLLAAKRDVAAKKRRMSECEHFKYCFGGCPHDAMLGERMAQGWSTSCCGLGSLIGDIQRSLARGVDAIPV